VAALDKARVGDVQPWHQKLRASTYLCPPWSKLGILAAVQALCCRLRAPGNGHTQILLLIFKSMDLVLKLVPVLSAARHSAATASHTAGTTLPHYRLLRRNADERAVECAFGGRCPRGSLVALGALCGRWQWKGVASGAASRGGAEQSAGALDGSATSLYAISKRYVPRAHFFWLRK
jgi:hypothetical protein